MVFALSIYLLALLFSPPLPSPLPSDGHTHLQYGEEFSKEVEDLWCALCTWTHNIRVTINYLARLTYVLGNMSLVLQKAKRIVVCFSRSRPHCIVNELINDLNVSSLAYFNN